MFLYSSMQTSELYHFFSQTSWTKIGLNYSNDIQNSSKTKHFRGGGGGGGGLKLSSLYCTINLSIVDTFIGSHLF